MYVSIIVPVYKVQNYLDECVTSLLNQIITSEQYEILLIDDGSPDDCGKKCDEYSCKYENVYSFHKENGGLSDTRNYGLEFAKGKYILFVDSDDFIVANCLEKIVCTCKEQNEPDIIFLQAKKLYPDGKRKKYDCVMDIDEIKKDKNSVLTYLSNRNMFPASAWSKMVKRDLLVKNRILFKKGQFSEDYEWSLSLFLHAKTFGAYNGEYYFYRQNRKGSITADVSEKHFMDLLAIIEEFKHVAARSDENVKKNILKFAAYIYRSMLWYAPAYYKIYEKNITKNKSLLYLKNSNDFRCIRRTVDLIGMKKTVHLLCIYRKLRLL